MADNFKTWLGKTLIRWGKKLAPAVSVPALPSTPPTAPFNLNARHDLDEMLGYERFVLNEAGDAIRTEQGKTGPTKIIINDTGALEMHLSLSDTIGDIGANMVRKMSPLVFTSSYKVLDMVFEWTIIENGLVPPWKFEEKIKLINKTTTLRYPDFLDSDAKLRSVMFAFYKEATPYRNAITHNRWGQTVQGALNFDFTRNAKQYKKMVPFDMVLAMADGMELLATMLVNQSADQNKLDTLRWLLDKLATFHGQPLFNITQPRYYSVVRRTALPGSGPLIVDLSQVRAVIQRQAMGHPATFDLTIEAHTEATPVAWTIPYADVPNAPTLQLDSTWDRYKRS